MARLHEYQGKAILAANGFRIPRGRAALNAPLLERAPDDGAVRFYQNYQAVSVLAGVYRLRLAAPGSQPFLRSP